MEMSLLGVTAYPVNLRKLKCLDKGGVTWQGYYLRNNVVSRMEDAGLVQ